MTTETHPMDTLAARFRDELGERVLDTLLAYDQLTVTVDPESFPQVARFCKQDLGMTFFDFLSAVDEREEGFSVVVRLYSHVKRVGVMLQTLVPGGREAPRLPTLTGVYAGANWHERETYDMFGIIFEGHPGLLPRILTVENFEGFPLRKEFKLASRIVKPWPGAKEPGGDDEDDKPKKAAAAAPGADPGDRAAAAKAKAERAKAKAAEARKRKAEEKAAAAAAEGGAVGGDDAEPGSAREAQAAAAGEPTPPGTPDPTTPEGAAEIADTAVAKDAAAGATAGQELASGEQPGSGEPQRDAEREAELAEGGPAADSGTPGVEKEGTHDLESSTARTDVSDEADPDDVAAREAAGVGEAGTGTFAESTRADHPDTVAGTDDDVSDAVDDPSAVSPQEGDDDE